MHTHCLILAGSCSNNYVATITEPLPQPAAGSPGLPSFRLATRLLFRQPVVTSSYSRPSSLSSTFYHCTAAWCVFDEVVAKLKYFGAFVVL
jgi:hypothetical protein